MGAALEDVFQAALAAQVAGRPAQAEPLYRQVLAVTPDDARAVNNLAWLLLHARRPDEALPLFAQAATLPLDPAGARTGLGQCLLHLSRYAEAEPYLQASLARLPDDPQHSVDLGLCRLGQGRFAEGWPLYDDFRQDEAKRVVAGYPVPAWRGQPLANKRLFVWREQGFGDQIMLARYLPMLAGARITYAGPPELERLFRQLPVDYLAVTGDWRAGPFDYCTLPFSLPRHLGGDTIPAAPYFQGTPRSRGGVGVAWRGSALPIPERSLSAAEGAALLSLPGAVSLDPADTGATDFQDTADLIAGLDLVITVDTSVAHLAGAMGKPVWILLPARNADWRWGAGTTTSWYPSARLYRQARPGDWSPVLAQVRRDLES